MKISERRQKEKESRKREICRKATELFQKQGYHNISIQKIAEKAGLGKGTVYYYYKNKEEIVLDLLAHLVHDSKRSIWKQMPENPTLKDSTLILPGLALEVLMRNIHFLTTFQREYNTFRKKARPEFYAAFVKEAGGLYMLCLRLFTRQIRKEGLSIEPNLLFDLIVSQVIGSSHKSRHLPDNTPVFNDLKKTMKIFYQGMIHEKEN